MKRIKVATIEIFVEHDQYTAELSDIAGSFVESESHDYLEDAVTEAIEVAKRCRQDEVLLQKAQDKRGSR